MSKIPAQINNGISKFIERIMNGPAGFDAAKGVGASVSDSFSPNSHYYDPYIAAGNAVQTASATYALFDLGTPAFRTRMQIYSLIAAAENLYMSVQNISDDIEKTGSFKAASVTDLIGDSIIFMSSTVNSYSEPKAKYAAAGLIAIGLRIKNYGQERLGDTRFNANEDFTWEKVSGFLTDSESYSNMSEEWSRFAYGFLPDSMNPWKGGTNPIHEQLADAFDVAGKIVRGELPFDPENIGGFLKEKFEDWSRWVYDWLPDSMNPWKQLNRDGKYHVYDPITLDLNGDGIQALATNGFTGALFDHDNDGIRTATGWVNKNDGLLVRDLNGNGIIDNGSELFGDNTTLSDGSKAAHGFEALAQLDSNGDGKVDALDSAFNELKVWIDANSDGISQASELRTLMDLGIQSLDVAYQNVNHNLGNGNSIQQLGSYTKVDGSIAQMGDAWLAADRLYSRFTDKIDMTAEQAQAANLRGTGRLRDLNQAAAASADLANVLKAYSQAQTKQEQLALLDSLVHEWAETDSEWGKKPITFGTTFIQTQNEGIALTPSQVKKMQENAITSLSDETQAIIDSARDRIAILDAFTGQDSSRLYYMNEEDALNIIKITNQTYASLSTNIYQSLLLQTRLQPYMNEITFKIKDNRFMLDFTGVQAAFNQVYETNPEKALVDLSELLAYGKLNTWYQGRQLLAHYVETARIAGILDNALVILGKETIDLLSQTSGNEEDNILQFTGLNALHECHQQSEWYHCGW